MPDWVGTVFDRGLATGLVLCGVYAAWRMVQFLGPKLTAFFESHGSLVESLKTNQQAQTELLSRHTDMLDDHGQKLQVHGELLGRQSESLDRIEAAVKVRPACDPS